MSSSFTPLTPSLHRYIFLDGALSRSLRHSVDLYISGNHVHEFKSQDIDAIMKVEIQCNIKICPWIYACYMYMMRIKIQNFCMCIKSI